MIWEGLIVVTVIILLIGSLAVLGWILEARNKQQEEKTTWITGRVDPDANDKRKT